MKKTCVICEGEIKIFQSSEKITVKTIRDSFIEYKAHSSCVEDAKEERRDRERRL